jgi:hypothetical protein
MLNEGFLSELFPKSAMVVRCGIEGWVLDGQFFSRVVIEDTIVDGHFERLRMDNFSENIIK